ncbi:MAG: BPSS1780 family membrane protein [Burkholderiaceae bacterium]
MRIISHPAIRGYYWLTEGLRIFRLQPLGLLAITFLALVIMSLPLVLPGVGFLLAVAIVPLLYVGLMHAIRQADQGQLPNPAMLFQAFQGPNPRIWQSLLVLGGVSAALTVLALGVTTLLGGSTMIDMSVTEPDSEAMRDPMSVLGPILVFFACYTPVQMALWFSPMFVAWHQISVGKALFFSIVAVWRNKARSRCCWAAGSRCCSWPSSRCACW